ncbi:4-hydroxyphenylacetate 3-monooxygenase, oxygenase component [Sulfobacillus harzensis]|uniref:4-hydroxyphenylacetate 3-monooxygenase, oxygenase component n=1 Tax=Sulfobacillus harzensis TaxID=2729629 RepID=A0A7Y0Q2F8_9FIRM|nr:4-hydroxyphenylacetate 3-monooxygenase, oxygenase component [Sulfobacillus harzensis]NMP21124.1 4-hydroxyphenylacetate 3-monooxygenase, oxygenase component [Sulfobacillus harzensis]
MGIRTGEQYLNELNQQPRDLWIDGAKVEGPVTEHPAFRNITQSVAALYDMQHDPALGSQMTYRSPSTGDLVGLSFMQPHTREDLAKRRQMMMQWARYSHGMMGRSPDYLNSELMAIASAKEFLAGRDPRFGENIQRYYEYVRENDLCLTHTLILPQVNRSLSAAKQQDPFLAARVVEKRDDGVVIRGARMLATLPVADEILVFPSTVIRNTEEDRPYAFAFALPLSTPGLRLICRESFDYGRSHFDHPLGSRFEEMDAVVVFDDVLVPWERIFILEDGEACNQLYQETDATVHMTHQVICKNIAKAEFVLGVAGLIVDTIGIEQFQHVQEKMAEIITALETMKAFVVASEAQAQLNRYGVMTPAWTPLNVARNTFPKMYPRLVEIIQQLSASGLMAIPSEKDFGSAIKEDVERFFQARNTDAMTRTKLFRLAWDIAISAFGSRQVLYERFFFGDPVRMAGALYMTYDKEPAKEEVRRFLGQSQSAGKEAVS